MQLTAVIVFYKVDITTAKTISSLQALRQTDTWQLIEQTHFILYDNSSQAQKIPEQLLPDYEYQHPGTNVGLAEAYNYGLQIAAKQQSPFLWLLDQDTELTAAYVRDLKSAIEFADRNTLAIVPQIVASGRVVSPRMLNSPFKVVPVMAGVHKNTLAINSGALVRPDFVQQCGGFSAEFKLDFLDNWLFFQIQQAGGTVFVLQSVLQHELSVMNTQQIKMTRYQSIIESEWRYYNYYQTISQWQYRGHLVLRIFSQLILKRDLEKARFLLCYLLRRKK